MFSVPPSFPINIINVPLIQEQFSGKYLKSEMIQILKKNISTFYFEGNQENDSKN